MSDTVLYEVRDGIATVTLNRPEKLNSMSADLLNGVSASLEKAASDDEVKVVVLTGSGRAFSVGGDLGGMSEGNPGGLSPEGSPETHIRRLRRSMSTSQLLHEMPKPTIAAINGPCAGAGLAWACAADIRYCAESAMFNTAFVTAGLSGDFGGTWTLPRIVGVAKARELYFLAQKFDAQEAERIGLVTRRFPDATFMEEVGEVAKRLAGFAPLTLREVKANLNDAIGLSFGELMDREAERHVRLSVTDDAREAATAYLEKRPPVFHGR
ncbi:MAG TPA: enoyl-CoA hydratase [Acidimicrobiales bacterium]|nr:enoyl-CoA hydratase [Acidimicrobiales bacterium]